MKNMVSEQDQSDFNAGIATLMRIDEIKKLLIRASLEHNIEDKYRALESYFLELVSIMDDKDDEGQKLKWEKIQTVYTDYRNLKIKGKVIPFYIWQTLIAWEMDLRNTEQKYGLNMPKKQDPRYAMMNRVRTR